MTYGCEAWNLDERTLAQLNGANARALSRFTGQTPHEEASKATRTYNMTAAVRKRRHQWLGHILRLDKTHDGKERLVKVAVRAQYQLNLPGNLCSDAPPTATFDELEALAQDRDAWRQHWEKIAPADNDQQKLLAKPAKTSVSAGRWLGDGPDAIWVAGKWIGSGIDAVWVNASDAKHAKPQRKQRKKKKNKQPEAKGWTDKQRQEWARAHYIANHGNPEDNRPLDVDWDELVEDANAAAHATAPATQLTPTMTNDTITTRTGTTARTPENELWAEPCVPPSPTPPTNATPTTTLTTHNTWTSANDIWAEPCMSPSPTPPTAKETPMSTTQAVTLTTTTTMTRPKQKRKQRLTQRQLFTPQQW